jgi:hypothetical protein
MVAMGTFSHNPAKSTTAKLPLLPVRFRVGGRRMRKLHPRNARVLPLLLTMFLILGCTSARHRESPTNIIGNLKFRDSSTQDRFADTYRSASLYEDFRTVLLADAIAMDQEYRRGYVEMLRKAYLLSDSDVQSMQQDQGKDFSGSMSLLLFLFGGTNRPIPLGQPTSQWKVLLQDDDGQVLAPATIEKLKPENPTYRYLSSYFYGLDRWAEAFKVSFPKLDKVLLRQRIGNKPIELIVTGLQGTVRMTWQYPRVVYGRGPSPATQSSN